MATASRGASLNRPRLEPSALPVPGKRHQQSGAENRKKKKAQDEARASLSEAALSCKSGGTELQQMLPLLDLFVSARVSAASALVTFSSDSSDVSVPSARVTTKLHVGLACNKSQSTGRSCPKTTGNERQKWDKREENENGGICSTD
ncbi:uncharacterized protein Hap1MRO34_025797 [Clarias gariepinus]